MTTTTFEVEYYNTSQATRTKIVEIQNVPGVEAETLIPFALRKLDKRFDKVKRIKNGGDMKCPHCKKKIDRVLVFSRCCQHGKLEDENGRFYFTDCAHLDVIETQAIECPECNGPLMHLVGEGGPLQNGQGTHVDLTVSVLEWTCPACHNENTESEAPATWSVQCSQCDIKFLVNEIHQ